MMSFTLALMSNDFSDSGAIVLYSSVNENDMPYRIIKTKPRDSDETALVYMRRDALGFWHADMSVLSVDRRTVAISWARPRGFRAFGEETDVTFETHALYYGTDATKLLELKDADIPANMTAEIIQSENEYSVHFMSFGDIDDHAKLLEKVSGLL